MFDTHAIARTLASADLTTAQVDAITDAVRQAAEYGEHVMPERLDAALQGLRADLYRAMQMQTAVTVGLLGLILAALRWLG